MDQRISRRALLKTAGLGAVAAAIPAGLMAQPGITRDGRSTQLVRNSRSYQFMLGNFRLTSISDGVLQPPAALFAGNATPEQLNAVLQAGFQSETLTADCNVLLVQTGRSKVLIDSGNGRLSGPTAGKLIENLAALKLTPADIDTVIITHAHGDHVGGLTGQADSLTFPKARYYLSNAEWNFWMAPTVTFPANFRGGEAMAKGFITAAQKQLSAIRDRVTRIEVNREFIPGFTALPTYGHTPGHIALRIQSGNASMIHTADVVHIHTINLWNPSWQPVFDADPMLAAQTRQRTLAQIAGDRTMMFAYHFPFPGVGHIRPRSAGGFEWEPMQWRFEA
jgi:glyoxylase-like metal-dependent hydrolase (beta-lactamase superfamily II)